MGKPCSSQSLVFKNLIKLQSLAMLNKCTKVCQTLRKKKKQNYEGISEDFHTQLLLVLVLVEALPGRLAGGLQEFLVVVYYVLSSRGQQPQLQSSSFIIALAYNFGLLFEPLYLFIYGLDRWQQNISKVWRGGRRWRHKIQNIQNSYGRFSYLKKKNIYNGFSRAIWPDLRCVIEKPF